MKQVYDNEAKFTEKVAPYAGAWIETNNLEIFELYRIVAPYAGAWIETGIAEKYLTYHHVAPYAGAWIETESIFPQTLRIFVAPYAGAWIETLAGSGGGSWELSSLPTRERGLKHVRPCG